MSNAGPLSGVHVLEIESIGPGPFAAMVLANLGADVLRISRPGNTRKPNPVLDRGRTAQLPLNLKSAEDHRQLMNLIERADVLIEGYRPGVMERLGLGPEDCLARNARLVYGRITGWGRSGPLALTAGHDINYIALTGALHACGNAESGPVPPLNLVGDFGGGGLMLAMGIACALLESKSSGRGQVVDAAMVDGAAMLMSMIYGMHANRQWTAERASNLLDGSAYFYTCYACADDTWVAVGAIETEFRRELFDKLGLGEEADELFRARADDPQIRARLAAIFRQRTRHEWQAVFEGSDACVSPVLSIGEAAQHPYNLARRQLPEIDGVVQPMPAPLFSRTQAVPPLHSDAERSSRLAFWGLDESRLSI